MTITAPLDVESQHDNQLFADNDIMILPDLAATAPVVTESLETTRDPLLPFLVLGVITLIAMLAIASALAF